MDLAFSASDLAFRDEVREFLRAELPPEVARAQRQGYPVSVDTEREWNRILGRKGWAAPSWPKANGGPGWNAVQRHIFDLECGYADAPDANVAGLSLVGPVICRYGSAEMQQRFLPPLLNGDHYYCQGFSEPQAGSDLATLRTRAMRDGDDYVITGQKIWTSHAHDADMMFCLARTDPESKPQAGLSMLLVPMHSKGVTVRPIVSIDNCHHLNEVFLEDVRVPAANLIGEPNKAWTYAKFLLDNERTHNAHIGRLKQYLRRIETIAADESARRGRPVLTPALQRRLARLAISVTALEWSVLRVVASQDTGAAKAAEASALKVRGSDLLLRISELMLEILGPQGLVSFSEYQTAAEIGLDHVADHTPGVMAQTLYWRASSIFGGSNDIQRGIIWNSLFRQARA